jgi:acyl carrier protein
LEKPIDLLVHEFIVENFLYGDRSANLGRDDSFLEKGIIDSTGVLELVAFIETKFGVKVHDEEIVPDNFDSLSKLTRFVEYKQNGGAHAG